LRVAGIKPDGTILLHVGDESSCATKFELDERTSANTNWEDVAA
jgi:hypothetical protein